MKNDVIDEIKQLPKEELIELLFAFDEYVYQVVYENQSEPVGLCEFYQYDYQEYVKGK